MSCDCGCGDWNLANADIAVLKQLREGVLANLPMSVWQSLIVDVEKAGGVLSVQGTAGKVIREAVQKASSSPAWQRKVKASEPSDEVDFEKGRFASRSEAARYAAQQRWKGNAKEGDSKTTAPRPTSGSKGRAGKKIAPKPSSSAGRGDGTDVVGQEGSATVRFGEMSKSIEWAFSEETLVKAGLRLKSQGYGEKEATAAELKLGQDAKESLKKILGEEVLKVQEALDNLGKGFMPSLQISILERSRGLLRRQAKATGREAEEKGLVPTQREENTVGSMVYTTKRTILENMADYVDLELKRANGALGRKKGTGESVDKASFASRSEAGRYAANERWKGNANESPIADGAVATSNIFGAGQAMNMESIRGAHEGALRSVKEGSRAFKELQLAQEDLVASSRADVTGNAFDAWNLGASAEFRVRQLAEASGARAPVKRLHKMLQQLVLDLTDAYYAESETNDSIDYPDYERERRNTEPTTLRVRGKERRFTPSSVRAKDIVKGDIVRTGSDVEARRVVGFGGDTRNDASVGEAPVVLVTQSLDSADGKLLTSSSSSNFKLVRFDEVVGKAMPQGAGDPRSNAGRYAAEQRWKGHTKKTEIDANLRQQGKTPIAGGETNQDPSGNVIDTLVEALSQYKAGNQVVVPAESVYTVLEELAAFAKDAKEKGDKATDLDLCKVSVPGTNLFCGENKGLLREEMPQLSGVPSKGSPADGMEKDKKGRANIGEAFVEHLRDGGVETREGEVPASSLKATQKQVIGADVAGIMKALEDGSMPEQTIFVSRDGYVIDGHHRWAATVGLDFKDGKGGDLKIKVRVIDLSIDEVLKKANAFADEMGMPRRSGDANADAKRKDNDDVSGKDKDKDKKKSKGKKTEG